MPADIAPAFVKINYHSSFAPHTQEVPTLQWNNVTSVGGKGTFDTWDGLGIDAKGMIEDLVTDFLPFFPSTVVFDNWVVYTKAVGAHPPTPVASDVFTGMAGSSGTPGWSKAVQETIAIRTAGFGLSKLVFLDASSGDNFDKIITTADPNVATLVTEFTRNSAGWSGRDNTQPLTFLAITRTLNEKLRRSYRMS